MDQGQWLAPAGAHNCPCGKVILIMGLKNPKGLLSQSTPNTVILFVSNFYYVRARAQPLHSCLILCISMDCSAQDPLSMDFPGKNTGMGCHAFLQGIFSRPRHQTCVSCISGMAGGFFPAELLGKPNFHYIFLQTC